MAKRLFQRAVGGTVGFTLMEPGLWPRQRHPYTPIIFLTQHRISEMTPRLFASFLMRWRGLEVEDMCYAIMVRFAVTM